MTKTKLIEKFLESYKKPEGFVAEPIAIAYEVYCKGGTRVAYWLFERVYHNYKRPIGIMNKLDFINLVTDYASHYRGKYEGTINEFLADAILTDFVNDMAATNCIDYGIRAEELEKHKRRHYTPQDGDVIISMGKQISEYETVLESIYMNTPRKDFSNTSNLIEHLAEKWGGSFEYNINLHKD